ncbi:MAG: DUF420 domain-containing protein [Myxococcota bacterium]|nr:DUF420 domain-containing protein [Myxococcota bacterium]
MTFIEALPSINAALNGTAAVLLFSGRIAIARKKETLHRACMVGAFLASAVFLVFYLYRFSQTGTHRFVGEEWIRITYLVILFSHMILAMVAVPLVLRTMWLAWKNRREAHRRLARWTFPIWAYVSVTGLVVYWMLYHLSAAA